MEFDIKKRLINVFKLKKTDNFTTDAAVDLSRAIVLNSVILFTLIVTLILLVISILQFSEFFIYMNVYFLVITGVVFFFYRKYQNTKITSYVFMTLISIQFIILFITGGINNMGYIWSLLIPLGVVFFFGLKAGVYFSLGYLFLIILLMQTFSVYVDFGFTFQIRVVIFYCVVLILSSVFEFAREIISNRLLTISREMEVAKQKAEESEKVKSQFLAQMSHEIRTPINTIYNYSSFIKDELEGKIPAELNDGFEAIKIATDRLTRTIDLILNISTVEAGTYEPVFEKLSLKYDIILPVLSEFQKAAGNKNLMLKFVEGENNDVELVLDQYSIVQALANLVHNAIKYTIKGNIEIRLEKSTDKLFIAVKDSGIGISQSFIDKLFDKFSQDSDEYSRGTEGNGLGLNLVKHYCDINNAHVEVESEKGVGSEFRIVFATN